MVMQVDLSPEYMDMMKTFANENEASDFINESVKKAIRNEAYLAKIRKGFKDVEEGKCITFTEEEWEKFRRENGI